MNWVGFIGAWVAALFLLGLLYIDGTEKPSDNK